MFQQTIPLKDLVEDVNSQGSRRLMYLLQKLVDYSVNKGMSIDDVSVTLTTTSIQEGKAIRHLECVGTGI